ncbi:D-xylose 1-dehydrogenase (NADP(+)) [Penicillium subrubescens]|uniref:D-xylose 1-dehydrogenase (NADP(+)) n=1 Tax=Penicillium subrubescens TaxID=1316194 RepID=UPI002544F3B1|nr:D-xylose 1-dehydrogenase (NADP(+)) [Penicillium subrubescens]KAJ5911066.1 D-xylose 1-dehydrogenase (NADP(+)) [Penicillium subrubescens]
MAHTIRWGIMGIHWLDRNDIRPRPPQRPQSPQRPGHIPPNHRRRLLLLARKSNPIHLNPQHPTPCTAYATYTDLVADPNVDVIYVATPHSHHFQNVMLALHAGKHVLCEKAFTVNAAQAKILVETAREKGLFLMEAVWTRFFPLSVQVRDIIQSGEIGGGVEDGGGYELW